MGSLGSKQLRSSSSSTSCSVSSSVEQVAERLVRAYGSRPASVRIERTVGLHGEVDEAAVSAAKRRLGWRVYATNHPQETLALEQAVLAYREEYLVERGFGRLKGEPFSLCPMYAQSDRRATSLISPHIYDQLGAPLLE